MLPMKHPNMTMIMTNTNGSDRDKINNEHRILVIFSIINILKTMMMSRMTRRNISVCSMCLFLFVCGRLNCFKFIAPGLNVSLQFVPPSLVSNEEDEEDCVDTNTVDTL